MRESPEAIVQAELDALVLEQNRLKAAVADDKRTKVAARVNAHTTAEADRAINATEVAIDRATDRIIAAVATASPHRRRTVAGATVLAGSSTDPVVPLAGSVDSELCQVVIKKSRFGREEHICNRPRSTPTPFGFTCRYHSQYRHDARRPTVTSTAASAAEQEEADDAELNEYAAAELLKEAAAEEAVAEEAAAEEAVAEDAVDEDILSMTPEEQANPKSVSRTSADSDAETWDAMIATTFGEETAGEPAKKMRKGKKSQRKCS